MGKVDLTVSVETLASAVVMASHEDLQGVNRIIKLFEQIAESTDGELAETAG